MRSDAQFCREVYPGGVQIVDGILRDSTSYFVLKPSLRSRDRYSYFERHVFAYQSSSVHLTGNDHTRNST